MKKIKLFALAMCAMLSANAFAQTEATIGIWKISYTDETDGVIVGFKNDAVAADVKDLVIPATLSDTEHGVADIQIIAIGDAANPISEGRIKDIETIDFTGATYLATIEDDAFKGATKLKSVKFGAALTAIDASAFEGCTALTTADFSAATLLASIGDYAFGGTLIATYDFSKCAAMLDFSGVNPFVASAAGSKNNFTSKVVLHANTTDIGSAFSEMTILDDINLSSTKVTDITASAFKGDVSLTALTFPETIQTIGATAGDLPFEGCIRLATLEIPGANLTQIGDNAGPGDFLWDDTEDYDKAALKTLKITGDVDAVLSAGAFAACTALKTVEIGKGKTVDGSNFEAGFAKVCDEASVTLGELTADFGAAAVFAAPADAAGVKGVKLTIEKISGAIATEIMSGKVATTVSGVITASVTLDALGTTATSLTFGGNISVVFTKYAAYGDKLTSINFGSVKLLDNQLPADMFGYGGTTYAHAKDLTVTWQPADGNKKMFIHKQAFAYATVAAANRKVTLSVTKAVADQYDFDEGNLFDVKAWGAEQDSEDQELTPANGVEGATTYFVKFFNAGNFKIAKTNGTAKVTVYEAYVDNKDATIYMLPMSVIDGYYYVTNNPVVVKSTSTDKITATAMKNTDLDWANRGLSGNGVPGTGATKNEIQRTPTAMTGASIMTDLSKTYYAMAKPEKYGLSWKTFKTSAQMPENTFYVVTEESSASRLNVVWLDEDNATAIQSFKAKAEAGQIYNLRGEKVNASYKGIVIKDGKKYIQK